MADPKIIHAEGPPHLAAAAQLFREYSDSLGFSLEFQGFEAELASLPGRYAPPAGCILVAQLDGEPVGCVALRELAPTNSGRVCEMKRLFVQPGARGRHIGVRLCIELIKHAKTLGYERMKLDTSADMHTAKALYHRLGFVPCHRYNDDPMPCTLYYELAL